MKLTICANRKVVALLFFLLAFSKGIANAEEVASIVHSGGVIQPSKCDRLDESLKPDDEDINIHAGATLNVMFHGNRFVAARDLVSAFEDLHPGEHLSWTAIPPVNSVKALRTHGKNAGMAGDNFMPDVVLGPITLMDIKPSTDINTDQVLENRGIYSTIKGMVLMARADDTRVLDEAWPSIINKDIRIILPGSQPRFHPLISIYDRALGASVFDELILSPRVRGSALRHHRSIPARIRAGCEDVGVQFLQSKYYWQQRAPGEFRYIDIPAGRETLGVEDSYVFMVTNALHKSSAELFVEFMKSKAAWVILKKYGLELEPDVAVQR